jgi:hypothetical protein
MYSNMPSGQGHVNYVFLFPPLLEREVMNGSIIYCTGGPSRYTVKGTSVLPNHGPNCRCTV